MKISLSALVPVCNAQATIGSLVSQMLDYLAELTHRFELVVIDNGSTDATAEVVAELAILYPQLSRIVLTGQSDWARLARAGLRHSSGEIVLYRGEDCESGLSVLGDLWQAMRLGDVAVLRPREAAPLGAIPPLPSANKSSGPDWQMVRRCALDGWLRTRSQQPWVSFLSTRGYTVQEIDRRIAGSLTVPRPNVALKLPAAWEPVRSHATATHGNRPTRRPNYLERLKAFALGE